MKINCQACGHDNELGRIFCGSCGKKLDMSQMSRERVSRERSAVSVGKIVKRLVLLLLVAVAVAAGLALWARAPFQETRAAGARTGAYRVRGPLAGVKNALDIGAETSVTFEAGDVNDYLTIYFGAGVKSISAEVNPGLMIIRVVEDLEWTVFDYDIGPLPYSYEIRCVPHEDGFRTTGAAIGRLPLPGPLAAPVYRLMAAVFADATAEKELLQKLSAVEFEANLIKAAFRP